jgi:hypothetical protein
MCDGQNPPLELCRNVLTGGSVAETAGGIVGHETSKPKK